MTVLQTSSDDLDLHNHPIRLEVFESRIDRTLWGCWLWTKRTDSDGYAIFCLNGKNRKAHRVAYETWIGPIPRGLTLDHICRVRNCVNPDHLEPVTNRENFLRGDNLMSKFARATFCRHGHEFTGDNTYDTPLGRKCRTCTIDRATKKVQCPLCGKHVANAYRKGHRERMHGDHITLQYLSVA